MSAQSDASTAPKATSYLPSISDFMIATIQARDVRLWIATRSAETGRLLPTNWET
jgi:hypothetical protein